MRTHVARWCNSLALCIRRGMADRLGIAEGRDVELAVEEGRLVVRAGPSGLAALLAGVIDDNLRGSFDVAPRGAEQL